MLSDDPLRLSPLADFDVEEQRKVVSSQFHSFLKAKKQVNE